MYTFQPTMGMVSFFHQCSFMFSTRCSGFVSEFVPLPVGSVPADIAFHSWINQGAVEIEPVTSVFLFSTRTHM